MNKNDEPTQLGKTVEYLHRIGFDTLDGRKPFEPGCSASVHIARLAREFKFDVDRAVEKYFKNFSDINGFDFNAEQFLFKYFAEQHLMSAECVMDQPDIANEINKELFNFQGDFAWNKEANARKNEFNSPKFGL